METSAMPGWRHMTNLNWPQLSAAAAINKVTKITSRVALYCGLITTALAQTAAVTPVAANYVNPGRMSAPVRVLLANFGDRIVRPGNERTTLSGTYSVGGTPAAATITWETPGRLRFDRSDQPNAPLILDDVLGVTNGNSLSQTDANILETLLDDGPEAFFYLIHQGVGHRYLGGRFRADRRNGEKLCRALV